MSRLSAKGADDRRQTERDTRKPLGGELETAPVLRVFGPPAKGADDPRQTKSNTRVSRVFGKMTKASFCLLISFVLLNSTFTLNAQDASVDKKSVDKQKHKRRPHGSGPTITPSSPAVAVGQSIALTSSSPVTWTLSGVGTLSNQTATSVTYTAPASVIPQNKMLGCPVLPDDTVFNTPVNNLPLDTNSAAEIAAQNQGISLNIQPSWGISYADNSTPTRTLVGFYSLQSYPNFVVPLPGPNLKRESGDYVGTFSFSANRPDHHIMTVRQSDCTFWETYDDYMNGYTRTCNDGSTPGCNVQSATTYASTDYNYPAEGWGTDAGGLLLAPLVWHLDEIKSGSINHAVRFTEGLAGIIFNVIRWPASATAGGCSVCVNSLPMGARLRLKASFNISSFSPTAQIMLSALQKYGMILADTGSNNAIQVATDVWSDPVVSAAITQISSAGIGISNFEVVDESSLQLAPNSYAVCPYNSTCVGAKNIYVQPLSQAVITATNSSGAATSQPIALQGIAIGLGVPSVFPIRAGSYSFQIPYWVNNTSNQTVNWTLLSGVGSVTSAGVYTPPSTTANSTTASAVLQGVSAADPNTTVTLYLTVLPPGVSPAGSVRIDTGALTNTTDANGNTWLADLGAEGTFGTVTADYPSWNTPNPLRLQFQTNAVGYGNDLRYTIGVPNGNYKVHVLLGVPYNGCANPCGYYVGYFGEDQHTYNPQMIETQGVLQNHYFDFGAPSKYAFAQPVDVYVPAKVTNNILQFGMLALAPDLGPNYAPAASNKYNILNGLEILPDTSAPHWTIDTQQQATITSGQTLRPFYVTDWYTGVNDPTWSVVSGPPGASFSGSTLTLAAGTYFNGQPIVVKASDSTYSATATLYTTGGTQSPLGILVAPPAVNHFSYKRAITINSSQVKAAQTNFPVEISITDPALETIANGGHVQNGYDLVLTSDSAGTNRLNWEVEKYDPAAGTWIAHVKIPSLSSTANTVIYLFYGNPSVTSDQSTPQSVWDNNFTGVYHMAGITPTTVPDSTAAAHNALLNSQVTTVPAGQIGPSASFLGGPSAAHFELPAAVLNAPQGTVSAWINSNLSATNGQNWVTAAQVDSSNVFNFAYWTSYFNATIFGWANSSTDYRVQVSNTTMPLPVNTWEHVVYTWNQATNTQVIYLNGTAIDTVTTAFTSYTPVSNFWIGDQSSNASYGFAGFIDEVRLSNIPRSASWIATEFANQNSPATFTTIGAETAN